MPTGQIVVIAILFVGAVIVGLVFRKVPKKITTAVLASMVFIFDAVLLTNIIDTLIGNAWSDRFITTALIDNSGQERIQIILTVIFVIFAAGATALSFLLVYKIENENEVNYILRIIALSIFAIGGAYYLLVAFDGIVKGYQTLLPGHICRQLCVGFPAVYFTCQNKRKWLLNFFCFAAIMGAIGTFCIPGNLALVSMSEWQGVDTIIQHLMLMYFSVALISADKIKPLLKQFPIGLGLFLAQLLFALFCNYLQYAQVRIWGNSAYLLRSPAAMPVWLYQVLCFVLAILPPLIIMLVSYIYKKKEPKQC